MFIVNLISDHEKGSPLFTFGWHGAFWTIEKEEFPKKQEEYHLIRGNCNSYKATLGVYKGLGDGQALNI